MEKTHLVLVVDIRNRDLMVSTASCTKTAAGEVILRKGADIGHLCELKTTEFREQVVLLLGDGYEAQSSEGFVRIIGDSHLGRVRVTGYMGYQSKGAALVGCSVPGTLVSTLGEVSTHKNPNVATAQAALLGFKLLAKAKKDTDWGPKGQKVILASGQSNFAGGWQAGVALGNEWVSTLPDEHQEWLFKKELFKPRIFANDQELLEAFGNEEE